MSHVKTLPCITYQDITMHMSHVKTSPYRTRSCYHPHTRVHALTLNGSTFAVFFCVNLRFSHASPNSQHSSSHSTHNNRFRHISPQLYDTLGNGDVSLVNRRHTQRCRSSSSLRRRRGKMESAAREYLSENGCYDVCM